MTPEIFLKSFQIRYKLPWQDLTAMVRVNNENYYFYESLTIIKTPTHLVYSMDNYFLKKDSLKFLKDYYPK